MLALKWYEHKVYMEDGYFTIRRSNKYYCGIPSDLAIECSLMKYFNHPTKGCTHGRGTNETDIAKWILCMPLLMDIFEALQDLTNTTFSTSEQHKAGKHDNGGTKRKNQDQIDCQKIEEWFQSHPPFNENEKIMSLYTGIIGDEYVNCYNAFKIGSDAVGKVFEKKLCEAKYSRKTRVIPLSVMSISAKN